MNRLLAFALIAGCAVGLLLMFLPERDGGDLAEPSGVPVAEGEEVPLTLPDERDDGQRDADKRRETAHPSSAAMATVPSGSPRAELRGQVLTRVERTPVSGARVSATFGGPRPDDVELETVTDAAGRFAWASTHGSFVEALLVGSTATTASRTFVVNEPMAFGRPIEVLVEVDAGATIEGRVLTVDGLPAAGVPVLGWNTLFVERAMERTVQPDRTATSAPDGTFRLTAMGEHCVIHAAPAQRWVSSEYLWGMVDGAKVDLSLPVRSRESLGGAVRGPDGRPLAAARVDARLRTPRPQDATSAVPAGFESASHLVATALTDASGAFALSGLVPGVYDLRVSCEGFAASIRRIEVPAESVSISLAGGATLEGVVYSFDGDPAGAARLTLHCREDAYAAVTDEVGSFSIAALPMALDDAYLVVDHEASALHVVFPVAAEQPLVIRLSRSRRLEGTASAADGAPLRDWLVFIEGPHTLPDWEVPGRRVTWEYVLRRTHTRTDENGAFAFDRVGDGVYQVTAVDPLGSGRRCQTSARHDVRVELRCAESTDMTATLRGSVLGQEGEAIADFSVVPFSLGEGGLVPAEVLTFSNASGEFVIRDLSLGDRVIAISAPGFEDWVSDPIVLVPGINYLSAQLKPAKDHVEQD